MNMHSDRIRPMTWPATWLRMSTLDRAIAAWMGNRFGTLCFYGNKTFLLLRNENFTEVWKECFVYCFETFLTAHISCVN